MHFGVYNTYMRGLVQKFLEILARVKLKRTRPKIIGVTGSFGKTTTKEAIAHILKTKWRVQCGSKSLNTEIGLLLSVLGQPSGFRSPVLWIKILAAAIINAFLGKGSDFLILEYGADKPGDIKHLVKIVRPDISVITAIARVHQAEGQFKNEESVFEEKKYLVDCLPAAGIAVLNGEDAWLKKLRGKLAAKTWWYGKNDKLDCFALRARNDETGFEADIQMGSQKIHAHFPIAGSFHINSILPALIIGTLHGISLEEGITALQSFKLPPGRMSIIPGKHGTILIDSSYNASPEIMKEALGFLKDLPGKRKLAVLGNMNELGDFTKTGHREVGCEIGDWLDTLVTVGDNAKIIAEECLKNGFPKARIKSLLSAEEAGDFLLGEIQRGDIVLLKGSQNLVRLERAVKIVMASPENANSLLCRQEPEWQKIK